MATYNIVLKDGKLTLQNISADDIIYVQLYANTDIPLIGLYTLDGVLLNEGDLVLCPNMTPDTEDAIYAASAGTWTKQIYSENPKFVIVEDGVAFGQKLFLKVESAIDSMNYIEVGSISFPAGTTGDTMYYDGTGWVANENFKYSEPTSAHKLILVSPISPAYQNITFQAGNPPYIVIGSSYNALAGTTIEPHILSIYSYTAGAYLSITDNSCIIRNNIGGDYIGFSFINGFRKYISSIKVLQHSENYLQAINLNDSGKQLNTVTSASGHIQSIVHDRARIDTDVVISNTTLTEVLTLATSFRGSVATAYSKTYSYKVKFKIFFDFDTEDGSSQNAGVKFKLIARSGTNTGTWEVPSEIQCNRLNIGNVPPASLQKTFQVRLFDYNNVFEQNPLYYDLNTSTFILEGEAFLNDFAFDDVEFAIQMAEYTTLGNMTVQVGSYINYKICNTNDV